MSTVHDFLELAAELGGQRFGPLPDEVVIGSDPALADLVVSEAAGLPGQALTLRRAREGVFTLHLDGRVQVVCSVRPAHQTDGEGRPARDGARLQAGETLLLQARRGQLALTLRHAALTALAAPVDRHAEAPPLALPTSNRAARQAPDAPPRLVAAPLAEEAGRQLGARALAGFTPLQQLSAWRLRARQGSLTSSHALVTAAVALSLFMLTASFGLLALIWRLLG